MNCIRYECCILKLLIKQSNWKNIFVVVFSWILLWLTSHYLSLPLPVLTPPSLALHPSCISFSSCLSVLSGSILRLLLELLELLFDKFKAVAQAHSVVLAQLQQIAVQCPAGAYEEGIKLYEQADVSAKIQAVLQVRYERQLTCCMCWYCITQLKYIRFLIWRIKYWTKKSFFLISFRPLYSSRMYLEVIHLGGSDVLYTSTIHYIYLFFF